MAHLSVPIRLLFFDFDFAAQEVVRGMGVPESFIRNDNEKKEALQEMQERMMAQPPAGEG